MKDSIYYAVKAKLIIKKNEAGEYEFLEINKEFRDDIPLLAREAAFRYYQNYIDVLLQAKGIEYETDKQAREEINSFIDPKTSSKVFLEGHEFEISDSFGNGIGVFMIKDVPENEKGSTDGILLIHGIGGLLYGSDMPESIMVDLETEYNIYSQNNFDTGKYETSIVFCDGDEWMEGHREDDPGTYTILKTPFDWTGMDKPYWWGEPEEEKQESLWEGSFEDIIAYGESNQVEFKPALHYNFKTKRAAIGIKGIIAKTICGFLNSNGGMLFIGVGDDGEIQVLSSDFSLSGDKQSRDYFRLQFDDTIKQFFPLSVKEHITGGFITIEEQEIFGVLVHPSKSKPVFMNGQHGKEFWVRWTASTIQYQDIEDITNYCLEHWKNNS